MGRKSELHLCHPLFRTVAYLAQKQFKCHLAGQAMQLDPHMLIPKRRTKDLFVDVNMLCSAAEVSAPGTCNFFCAAAPQLKSKSQARYAVSDA